MKDSEAYITTYTGKRFFFLDPKPEQVDIEDIAYALSNTVRWGGHCSPPITVAQHSVMVSHMLLQSGYGPMVQLQGLLHDAAEAYIPDIPSPIKPFLTNFTEIEEYIERVVFEALGVDTPFDKAVKIRDVESFRWEARDLMQDSGIAHPTSNRAPLMCWTAEWAGWNFLDLYFDLKKDLADEKYRKESAA